MHRHVFTSLMLSSIVGILSGCASDRLVSLERQNHELRELLAIETAKQMREIGLYAVIYAQDHENAYPTRPSEFREILMQNEEDWSIFLSPYDARPNVIMSVAALEDPWAWIDANASYDFSDASLGPKAVVYMSERDPVLPGIRYTLFSDTRVEAVTE